MAHQPKIYTYIDTTEPGTTGKVKLYLRNVMLSDGRLIGSELLINDIKQSGVEYQWFRSRSRDQHSYLEISADDDAIVRQWYSRSRIDQEGNIVGYADMRLSEYLRKMQPEAMTNE